MVELISANICGQAEDGLETISKRQDASKQTRVTRTARSHGQSITYCKNERLEGYI